MSDASSTATPTSTQQPSHAGANAVDPLASDWSEGLPGPLRAHGIAPPRLISAADASSFEAAPEAPAPFVESPESPAGEAPLPAESEAVPPSVFEGQPPLADAPPQEAAAAEAAAPGPEDATAFEAPADSAPTPWSEPVETAPADAAPALDAWQMMPAPTESPVGLPAEVAAAAPEVAANEPPAEDTWSAPAAADPVQEWQPESPAGDWQEVRKPDAEALPEAPPPADWGALRSSPDWSAAPANAAPAQEQSWDAPPPPAQEPQWAAAPAAGPAEEWTPPAPVETPARSSPAGNAMADEAWSEPANEPAAAPAAKPAWNQAAVGASALEQLDSEPPPPEPGAAKELFGSLSEGGLLGGSEEGENDLGPPEELASPEEVLRPVSIDHDDPDLPSPTGEPARTKAQPLAAWKPAVAPGLAVNGEHRVAVHTRGGRTLRGTLRDVDLSKSQFAFVPQGGGEVEAIYRADVKAIFFMLAPGEPPHGGDGAKVRVTFADGRIIEGTRDGADAKHGFFLVPSDAARTNTLKIYVSREAISDIADS